MVRRELTVTKLSTRPLPHYLFTAKPEELRLIAKLKPKLQEFGYQDSYRIAKEIIEFTSLDSKSIEDVLVRLAESEPWEYIRGITDFCGFQFVVNSNVLIPRVETEQLVDLSYRSIMQNIEHIYSDCIDVSRMQIANNSSDMTRDQQNNNISISSNLHKIVPSTKCKDSDSHSSSDDYCTAVNIIDIGTGSGCIIISLYKKLEASLPRDQFERLNFYAIDISKDAIEVARHNAIVNEIHENGIEFIQSDLLPNTETGSDSFTSAETRNELHSLYLHHLHPSAHPQDTKMSSDTKATQTSLDRDTPQKTINPSSIDYSLPTVIISNPPYVSESEYEELDRSVKDYEPSLALIADDNGLAIYNQILMQILDKDIDLSALIFECSPTTSDRLKTLIDRHLGNKSEIVKDLFGQSRFILHLPIRSYFPPPEFTS